MMDQPPPKPRPRASVGICLSAFGAALWYGIFVLRTSFVVAGERYFVLFEDAMISMRYARNLARGYGLVWNAGEPPVEGYTNFLWTLWMSIPHLLGLPTSKTSLFVMLTGVAILLALGFVTGAVARRLSPAPWLPWVAASSVWFSYPLVFWTLRGMEVGAVALFLMALLHTALAFEDAPSRLRAAALGCMAGACMLVRSDSGPAVMLLMSYTVWRSPASMRAATTGFVVGLPTAALLLHLRFRHGFYHDTLPNTAYLKLFHIPLAARLKRGLFTLCVAASMQLAIPLSALAAFGPRAFAKLGADSSRRRLVLLYALFGVQNAYSIFVGGDAWEWFRFTNRYSTTALPILSLLLLVSIARSFDVWKGDLSAATRHVIRTFAFAVFASGLSLVSLQLYARRFGEEGMGAGILYSSKVLGTGAALVIVGAAALAGAKSSGLVRLFQAMRDASLAGSIPRWMCALLLGLLLVGQADPMLFWLRHNAPYFADEAIAARLGLLIAASTPKDLRVAVVAAGATPYFADRPTEDILGKSDAVIAKQTPKLPFFAPGHDKWDYVHSLRDQKPALVVELPNDEETNRYRKAIDEWGFEQLANGLWLQRHAVGVDRRVLGSPYQSEEELDALLALAASSSDRTR